MSGRLASTAAVERFLQRSLTAEQYHGMRLLEPCVVQTPEDGRGIKFVVVLEDSVMVCDNPPKKTSQLFALRDVSDIALVHEVPEFLQAELGRKVTHVRVRVRREPRLSRSASPTSYSPRASRQSMGSIASPRLSLSPLPPTADLVGVRKSISGLAAPAPGPQKRLSLALPALGTVTLEEDTDSLSGSFDGRDLGPAADDAVHLYTLQDQSRLIAALDAARLDAAIRESLPPMVHSGPRVAEDQHSTFLRGIMKDLAARKDIEARFELVDQLHSACSTSLGLRRHFWKTREHYAVLADQLVLHLGPAGDGDADAVEYASLVAEALSGLIAADPARSVLFEAAPRAPGDIVTALLRLQGQPHLEPSLAASIRRSSVTLLYELFEHVMHAPDSPVTLATLTGVLAGSAAGRAFAASLVGEFLRLLDRPALFLDGAMAISTFRQARLCTRLVSPGSVLAESLRTSFRDEFRYMVNVSALRTELAGSLPINAHMLACVVMLREAF
eukprot:m.24244 g.24244  ORF g.24244 m.24244 type:complete len:501 (+) comp8658_c0_seq1:58-1560(+)